MEEANPYLVRDGGTLLKLDNGLEIVRRQKHEWSPGIDALSPEQLIIRTGKVWGSKFYSARTLPALVKWIEGVIAEEGWSLDPGHPGETDRLADENIGLVRGQPTRKIRVVCDGRYVHAYPIAE